MISKHSEFMILSTVSSVAVCFHEGNIYNRAAI